MKKKVNSPYGFSYEWELLSLEKAEELVKNQEGSELTKYKALYNECASATPYLLNDGKVVITYPVDAMLFSTLKGYISDLKTSGLFKRHKRIMERLPKQKIEFLSGNEKVYYYELPKTEGEVVATLSKQLEQKNEYPRSEKVIAYKSHEGELIEHNQTQDAYYLFLNEKDYNSFVFKRHQLSTKYHSYQNNMSSGEGFFNPVMCGRNPYGKDFIDKVDDLINQIPNLLHTPDNIMNLRIDSLPKIENYLYRHHFTDDFTDKIFLPLLAYIGKSIISNEGGEWNMRYDELFKTWTPDIKYKGKWKEIYIPLLKILDTTNDKWYPLATVYNHNK